MSVCVLYIFPVLTTLSSKKPGNRGVYNQWFSATSSQILPTTSDKTSSSTDMRHPQNIQTSYSKLKPEHGLSFCSLIGSQKEAWAVEAVRSRLPEVKATGWGRHESDRALSHVNRWQCVAFWAPHGASLRWRSWNAYVCFSAHLIRAAIPSEQVLVILVDL